MKLLLCLSALLATAMSDASLEDTLKSANDQFTASMFQEVLKKNEDKSVVQSAYSVLPILAQLSLASEGPTHDEILKTIGLPNDNVTKAVFADVTKRLRAVKGVELKEANKVYVGKDYSLNEQFAALSKEIFNSEVQNIDFGENVKAAKEMNDWVEENTNHRIKDLVKADSLNPSTAAVLVNAIYFKGKWMKPFKPHSTYNGTFHVTSEKTVTLPLMYQQDDFNYAESAELDAQILEMKYEGDETSMLIVLPKKTDGIKELTEKLRDPTLLNKAVQDLSYQEVQVTLPRFKIETTTDLKEVLTKMNIKKLFKADEAQLTNLLKESKSLYVSSATQKAFIEVKEDGAEAAAANLFVGFGSSYNTEEIYFKANHPFYFVLMESKNKNILFNGVFVL